jgi:hypothetical protein
MKRSTFITIICLLIPLLGISQTKTTYVDDIYLKPSDAKTQQIDQTQNRKTTPNYKNGAKEIVYIERDSPNTNAVHDTVYVVGQANENLKSQNTHGVHDTVYVVGEANDNLENHTSQTVNNTDNIAVQANDSIANNQGQGYYLNGFNGTESDLEYAERIRHFHNPKYEISVADPRYNDIYFLNNFDWNVYIDGSYAYVTPTWTNPYWWNYNYNPYSYGNWGFGFNNYYSPFYDWYDYPWGFDSFYGGFGYGYPYFGYGYGYNSWGRNVHNGQFQNRDEGNRREVSNLSSGGRLGTINNASHSMMISGGSNNNSTNPYTTISSTSSRNVNQSVVNNTSGLRSANTSNSSTVRTISTNRNGIGLVRIGGLRNLSGLYQNNNSGVLRSATTYTINTNPRTTIKLNSATVTSRTNSFTTIRNANSGNYSTVSRSNNSSVSSSTSNRSNSYSTSNSNFNSSSRSSGSYSGGSSGGSRSTGGGGNRR